MPPVFGTAVLMINILFFLLTTWSSATAPESFAAKLGLGVVNAGGINEVRRSIQGSSWRPLLSAPLLSSVCCRDRHRLLF